VVRRGGVRRGGGKGRGGQYEPVPRGKHGGEVGVGISSTLPRSKRRKGDVQ
jgi:hypothetical protein